MKYIFIVFIAVSAFKSEAMLLEGKVIKIADGDTVTILDSRKNQQKIRLAGIDCPEKHQAWGNKAKQAIASQIFNKQISVKTSGKDRYGRHIGVIYLGPKNINRLLIQKGNCWVYPRFAKDQLLFDLHDKAKEKRIGLWSMHESQIIPPWEFRKK